MNGERRLNDGVAIDSSIAKWIELDFNALFTIAYCLKDEPLQQIGHYKTLKEHEMNYILSLQ